MVRKYLNRVVCFFRNLPEELRANRTLTLFMFVSLIGMTLPAFYPDYQNEIVSNHNGILLGFFVTAVIVLEVIDAFLALGNDEPEENKEIEK